MNKSERWAKRRVKCWEVTFEVGGKEMRYVEMAPSDVVAYNQASLRLCRRYGSTVTILRVEWVTA